MADLTQLVSLISETQQYFKQQAQRQVNTALTLRNWLFGFYIAEYELNGADRTDYGSKLYKEIANQLQLRGQNSVCERHLYLCTDFYNTYSNILRSATAKSYITDFQSIEILRSVTAKFEDQEKSVENDQAAIRNTELYYLEHTNRTYEHKRNS